ncbi:MAG: putative rane protein [Labilithrix sp.]|nr:putative rane protein [Labilithrix sp.]
MFVEKRSTWLTTVLLGGVALPNIWGRIAAVSILSVVVTALYAKVSWLHYSLTTAPFVMTGLPLGIFLGFRNNTAYDRFWEARKLWGGLVNTSRSLTRQVLTLVEAPAEEPAFAADLVHLLIGYVHALRHHLRDSKPWETLTRVIGQDETERLAREPNVPIALVQRMGDRIAEARRRSWIHPLHVTVLEQSLVSLTDIQGACERIKSTPIPYSYTVLMHRIVAVYCTLLPFGLDDSLGWGTPVVTAFISYALFGLDAIGEEIEQPFGLDRNDLALSTISRMIENNLRVRLGEEPPKLFEARDGVLP